MKLAVSAQGVDDVNGATEMGANEVFGEMDESGEFEVAGADDERSRALSDEMGEGAAASGAVVGVAGGGVDAASGAVRERILAAAMRVFSDKGFAASSMREIAEVSGVSKPMLYYYFNSKEGLIDALLTEMEQNYVTLYNEHFQRPVPFQERVASYLSGIAGFLAAAPDVCRFGATILNDNAIATQKRLELIARRQAILRHTIAAAQAEGELRSDISTLDMAMYFESVLFATVAHSLFGSMCHTTSGAEWELTEARARTIARLLCEGMQETR